MGARSGRSRWSRRRLARCLEGRPLKKMVFLSSSRGRQGKGVLSKLMRGVMGTYFVTAKPAACRVPAFSALRSDQAQRMVVPATKITQSGAPPHADCNTAYPLAILCFPPTQMASPLPNCGTGIILELDDHPKRSRKNADFVREPLASSYHICSYGCHWKGAAHLGEMSKIHHEDRIMKS